MIPATSGVNVSEPLAYFDPATRSLRTFQDSLLLSPGDSSTALFLTWPRSGMWDATTFSALPSAVRPTVEKESGLWPTQRASEVLDAPNREGGEGCSTAAAAWATPRAEDGERGKGSQFDGLSEDVTAWATPSTRDHKDSDGMATSGVNPDGSHRERLDQLPRHAFAFDRPGPTPSPTGEPMAPSDSSPPEPWNTPKAAYDGRTPEAAAAFRLEAQKRHAAGMYAKGTGVPSVADTQMDAKAFDGKKKPSRGLNPRFALWLMGFPTDWLDAQPPKKSKRGTPARQRTPNTAATSTPRIHAPASADNLECLPAPAAPSGP